MKHLNTSKQIRNLFNGKTICVFLLTLILFSQQGNGQIVAWQFGTPASTGSESTYNATTSNANLTAVPALTRGSIITGAALARAFSSTNYTASGTRANALSTGQYVTFSISAAVGYRVSLSTLDARLRRTATGPNAYTWQWSTDGMNFTDAAADVSFTSTVDGVDQAQINLSGITALQNVLNGTTITMRLYAWGASATGGTFAIGRYGAAITTNSLAIGGSVNPIPTKLAVPTITPSTPTQNAPFDVTVQAQDATNTPQTVVVNTNVTLSLATGSGNLGGTLTGTILAGSNSTTISGVTYDAIDNSNGVSITATRTSGDVLTPGTSAGFNVQSAASPAIVITGSLTAFSTELGTPSATQSYSVSGSNLGVTDITITPPVDYEIRTTGAFSNTPIMLTPTGGTVNSTNVDVRFNPSAAGASSGNITHVSSSASQNQPVSGFAIETSPTTAPTVTFGNVAKHLMVINFSGGDGASRIVVVRAGSPVSYVPTDGAGPTGVVSTNFTSATDQGGGNRIVMNGSANTVTVTNLTPATVYHVAVYEYNGTTTTANYYSTPGINNTTTAPYPNAVPVSMAGLSYTEDFADIANWADDFDAGIGSNHWVGFDITGAGTIPDGTTLSASTRIFQSSGSSGGVQRGSLTGNPAGTIVLLSTGTADNSSSCAIDILLDYTGVNAGTVSFDWSVVVNGTGDRAGSLRLYSSTDGISYAEIPAAAVLNKPSGTPASGSITTVALPASFNNSATARLRFYNHNGNGGSSGSRPKFAIDNLVITATPPPGPPTKLAITTINPASPIQNQGFAVTVVSQDANSDPQPVLVNTDVTLTLNSGTGALSGTLTGTITAGTNNIVISGVLYNVAESGVSLTATRTAGDILAPGNSAQFTVLPPPPPTITVTGTLNAFNTAIGTPSGSQSYSVSGASLTANLVITPPAQFEISLNNATWVDNSSNISITPSSGTVASTQIFVRYNPASTGPHSGNITHTSTGATTQNQPVSGSTEPTTASTVTFGCATNNSIIVNFTGGNGVNRIVVANTAAVSYTPTDGVGSTGVNSDFSVAVDQGGGDKIVYDGSGNTVTVTGLTSSTGYNFRVYEYNGTGVTSDYLLTPFGSGSATTNGPGLYSITGNNYTQNFDGLPSAGPTPTYSGNGPFFVSDCPLGATNLNGWQFGKTAGSGANAVFTVSTGSSTAGSAYSYGSATNIGDRALGALGSGGVTPNLGLVLVNNTNDVLQVVTLSYIGEQWKKGGSGQSSSLVFSYQVNGSNISTGTFTPVPLLDFSSLHTTSGVATLDGNDPANRAQVGAVTFALNGNWAPGQSLVLRWDLVKGGGAGDGLGIDDLVFSAATPSAPITQDHHIMFSNVTTVSITADWTNGDGANHLVKVSTVNTFTNPVDGNSYPANPVYGGGEQVVYDGTGNSINVTNLTPNTNYFFRVYGFNGAGPSSRYITGTAVLNPNNQPTNAPAVPDHLVILSVNGGNNPSVNQPFTVVVQAQDAQNNPQPVSANTTINLATFAGTGNVGGTTSDVILSGATTVTITGVTYDVAEVGVQIEASAPASVDNLTSGVSTPFEVIAVATDLSFTQVPFSGSVNTVVSPIKVSALRPNQSVDPNFTGNITISVNTGPGNMTGTLTQPAVAGVATFNDIQFDAAGGYTLLAQASGLNNAISSTITITIPPVLTELVIPQYMGSKNLATTNNQRTPIAACIRIDNLVPNATYNLAAAFAVSADAASTLGAGNIWTSSGWSAGNPTITGAFTTDANGSSGPYWLYLQQSGNGSHFDAGQIHHLRYAFSTASMGTSPVPNIVGTKTITCLDINTSPRTPATTDDGAFIKGNTDACISGKYALLYDNVAGTGDPLFSYQVRQMIPTNTNQSVLPADINEIYNQSGASVVGDYVGVIPAGSANGVQRIEIRNADYSIYQFATDADGSWPSGAVTTGMARHTVAAITATDAVFSCGGGGVTLNLTLYLQGYYRAASGLMDNNDGSNPAQGGLLYVLGTPGAVFEDVDTVDVSVMSSVSPYDLIETQRGILQTDGELILQFTSQDIIIGQPYYLKINHRNSIETWTEPVELIANTDYSIISDPASVVASNEIQVQSSPDIWAIFSGDVNQDFGVDITDYNAIDPDVQNGEGGYLATDITGDGAVDLSDILTVDPNVQNGVGAITP